MSDSQSLKNICIGIFAAGAILMPVMAIFIYKAMEISPDALWIDQQMPTVNAAWNAKIACFVVPPSLGCILGIVAQFRTNFHSPATMAGRITGIIGIALNVFICVVPLLRIEELYGIYRH